MESLWAIEVSVVGSLVCGALLTLFVCGFYTGALGLILVQITIHSETNM